MKDKTDTWSVKTGIKEMLTIGSPFLFVFLMNLFFNGMSYHFWFIVQTFESLALELIITCLISIFLFGIVKKYKRVITIMGVFILILSLTNQVKYIYMEEPLLFSDVAYLGSIGEAFDMVHEDLITTFSEYIIPILIEIILFAILIAILRKLAAPFELKKKSHRMCAVFIPLLFLILLYAPIPFTNNFVLKHVFSTDKRVDMDRIVYLGEYYSKYGIVDGMYGQLIENRVQEPEKYREEEVNLALASIEEKEDKSYGKPNIIVIFSESFWDIDQLSEIEFDKPITSHFNSLKEKRLFFNMISPSYGGVSANVEFEFLTGANVMFYVRGFIPYMQLYDDDTYYHRPSIIQELKNNGYKTKIVTPTTPALFQCGKAYKYLQVDEVEYLYDLEDRFKKGQYLSDEYLMDKIMREFDEKENNEKLFYMTLTMQNHMTYAKDKYDQYDIAIINSPLSGEMNDTLLSYAQGTYDADIQLGRMYDYIQTLEEPTLLVFYGDHLPYLKCGNQNVINYLEFFNTGDSVLNDYRKYNTQALVLSNYEINETEKELNLGPDLLSAYIMNHMDIEISNYYQWLYQNKEKLGTSNFKVTSDYHGNLYSADKMPEELKEIYDLRRNIEYQLFVK